MDSKKKKLLILSAAAVWLAVIGLLIGVLVLRDKDPTTGPVGTDPTQPTDPVHSHRYTQQVTEPTCLLAGYTTYICDCGHSYTGNTVLATGHSYTDVVIAPTCETSGYTTHKCLCGDSYTDSAKQALGHAWNNATCVAPKTCARCRKTEGTVGDHTWDAGVLTIVPTEELAGEKRFTCVVCGTAKTEVVPALGHIHTYHQVVTAPTCTEKGYITYTCACGDTYQANETEAAGHSWLEASCENPKMCRRCDITEGEALGHDWQEATCEMPKTCLRCSGTEGVALGHTWQEATCETPQTCLVCGKTEGTVGDHSWDQGEVTVEATDEQEGEKRFTCTVCGTTKTVILPMVGHVHHYDAVSVIAPTCIKPGYTIRTCRCGDSYNENEVAALGHAWRDATCTVPKTCKRCGKTEGIVFGHTLTAATCETPKTCLICGGTVGEPLGHDWLAATCETIKTCTVCGATEGEPLGHDWLDATCETPKTCGRCGITEGEPLGHDWLDAACETPKTCAVCGATEGDALGHRYAGGYCIGCGLRKISEGLVYTMNADGVSYAVTGIGTCSDTDVIIPDVYKDLPVTAIMPRAFANSTGITSVIIGQEVEFIGVAAFAGCSNLITVTFGDKVASIGLNAFEGCTNLITIIFTGTVEQWNASVIKQHASLAGLSAVRVVCKDGVVAF